MEASRSDSITVLGLSISEKKRSRNVKQRPHSRPVREGTRVPCELLSTGDRGQEGAQSPAARAGCSSAGGRVGALLCSE